MKKVNLAMDLEGLTVCRWPRLRNPSRLSRLGRLYYLTYARPVPTQSGAVTGHHQRFQLLIRQLMHLSLNQGGFSAYPLIQKLTDRFYPKAKAASLKNGDLVVLEGMV